MSFSTSPDKYTLQARAYPGLLTVLPLIVLVLPFVIDKSIAASVVPLVVASGVFFLMVNIVRSRGIKREVKLVNDWNGPPTTHMLRLGNSNDSLLFRRRRKLESVYGAQLPNRTLEQADSADADRQYVAATRALITKVNQRRDEFPRVHEENINYGFRRNLLALKPFGIAITLTALCADGAIAYLTGISAQWWVAVVIHASSLATWLGVVRPEWVWEVGSRYAHRLFETLEVLDEGAPPHW